MAMVISASNAISRAASSSTSTTGVTVASLLPANGEIVGVAQPVTVRFTKPIADRAAAERTIDIISPNTPTGRFTWLNDAVAQWVPNSFWPAHTEVTAKAGPLSTEFETGAAVGA
jgi:lipoprotein-anchoring transpeptidase ErfK/SrfK